MPYDRGKPVAFRRTGYLDKPLPSIANQPNERAVPLEDDQRVAEAVLVVALLPNHIAPPNKLVEQKLEPATETHR